MSFDYRFCPQCATPLVEQHTAGRLRIACPAPACGFVHWNNPLPVLAAVVEYRGQMFLARNAQWPEGMFALVTGFMEHGETPEEGIARELKEETNLDAQSISLIGVYEFIRKNELIIAYHVVADGEIALSEELVEYRLKPFEKVRPWTAGTGYAVADFLTARGLPVSYIDIRTGEPAEPPPRQWQPTRLATIAE
ncbi:NUDIX hydrolase [Ralstonia mannitolilytica]|uniref:NADH pyrophosphatase n=1 Tax=Ralstonia mannitolilytica TaxID=105219 RepID=A0AAD2EN12_9RALS|nr:NUDIX hydrolase [Ralstonia mannitolilytica]ANA34229.1 NADH pyrophosphatase [Ralstonia mannitolilytica]MBY4717400.1 NUDIX hydrolase [Ralstonia mannitolilytica]CAJ0680897.1 NADH pyrophosphatase [Ralstonia mannitolilytica]CAJ0689889.1 NADH pyrophosphatase [Ralstonia mannitolilytica]CAJ0694856.1 NADH pyrophosphatase [Ralstonia mannitolilytica]